jgi:hypothetical protein
MTDLSRRSLVAGAAALPALAVPAIAADKHPDEKLLKLGREFDRLADIRNAAVGRMSQTYDDAVRMTIPVPDSLRPKADDTELGIKPPGRSNVGNGYYGHCDMNDIRALNNPRAREIVTDYNRWLQSHNDAKERSGLNAAERDFYVIDEQIGRVGDAISTTPAHTVDGMKVKARVVYCYMLGEINQEGSYAATASILRDLMRLQGQEPMSPSEYEARYQRTSSNSALSLRLNSRREYLDVLTL